MVNSSGGSFLFIKDAIKDLKVHIREVTNNVQDLVGGTTIVIHSINQIHEVTRSTSVGTEQVVATTEKQLESLGRNYSRN